MEERKVHNTYIYYMNLTRPHEVVMTWEAMYDVLKGYGRSGKLTSE